MGRRTPHQLVELALAIFNRDKLSHKDALFRNNAKQAYKLGQVSKLVDVMLWIAFVKRGNTKEDALRMVDVAFKFKPEDTRPDDRGLGSMEEYEQPYADLISGDPKPKKKTKVIKKEEEEKEFPREDDSDDDDDDDDDDEGVGVDDGEDDDVGDKGVRFAGKGTGKLDEIPDGVVTDSRIFTPLAISKDQFEHNEHAQAIKEIWKKKEDAADAADNSLDPTEYDVYELTRPFDKRPPYTNEELGYQAGVHAPVKFFKYLRSQFGIVETERDGRVDRLFWNVKPDVEDAEEKKYEHIHAHTKTVKNVNTAFSRKRNKDLRDFLLALTGFSLKKVHQLWHLGGERKYFIKSEILTSNNLARFLREAVSVQHTTSYHASPTLMYLLKEYAAEADLPVREHMPRPFLDILLLREIIERLTNIKKMLDNGVKINDKDVEEEVKYVRDLGFTASLVYEVVADQTVKLNDFSHAVHLVFPIERMRGEISAVYGDSSTDGKRILGFFLAMSDTKSAIKAHKGYERELEANKNPVIFNPVKMKYFSLILQGIAQKKDKDAWKAAALLIELHTGARITEALGYADFFEFSEMDLELQKMTMASIKERIKSYSLQNIGQSVVQVGVLKRKSKAKRKPGDEYDVFDAEVLPPKPVLWDLDASDIKKLVYVVRSYIYEVMKAKYPNNGFERLNELPPSYFDPFVGRVNTFLDKHIPKGAIENLDKKVTSHMLRRFYANYSYEHHAHGMVRNVWIMTVLGHDQKGLTTSLSYTNATIKDPLAFIPVPQKGESLGIQAFNALQDIKYEMKNALADVISGVEQLAPKRKRKRNQDDGDGVVAVLLGPPATISRVMPPRDVEMRISKNDQDAQRKKADVVKQYVEEHCRFEHEGHFYLCKPNWTTLSKCHFGADYINAFLELEADFVRSMSSEYDDIVDSFLV